MREGEGRGGEGRGGSGGEGTEGERNLKFEYFPGAQVMHGGPA